MGRRARGEAGAAAATWEPVESLRGWAQNPRLNADAILPVALSISRFGFGAPIVARAADREVIAGHTRLAALEYLAGHVLDPDGSAWRERRPEDGPCVVRGAPGPGLVPVRLLDLSEHEAHALALADNRLGEIADWDEEKLSGVLSELGDGGLDLSGLGWSDAELAELVGEDDPSPPAAPLPPARDGIDLRCCSCADVDWPEADLVIADPPWRYRGAVDSGTVPTDHYTDLATDEIAAMLRPLRARVPLLALWVTWPLLGEWWRAWDEDPVTGAAWTKSGPGDTGMYGAGYWFAGCSEPMLLYSSGGGYRDPAAMLRGAWVEPPEEHSRKPVAWMVQMIRRWVPEGGLVLDPFAGLGSVAEAVMLAGGGRRYLGTELSPERHAAAMALLAQVSSPA